MSCSFGGPPGRGAHQALASLHEVISGRNVEWVLEADLKNFFGSLSHDWMLRFVEHRVGVPRLISLIRRKRGARPNSASATNPATNPAKKMTRDRRNPLLAHPKGQEKVQDREPKVVDFPHL